MASSFSSFSKYCCRERCHGEKQIRGKEGKSSLGSDLRASRNTPWPLFCILPADPGKSFASSRPEPQHTEGSRLPASLALTTRAAWALQAKSPPHLQGLPSSPAWQHSPHTALLSPDTSSHAEQHQDTGATTRSHHWAPHHCDTPHHLPLTS